MYSSDRVSLKLITEERMWEHKEEGKKIHVHLEEKKRNSSTFDKESNKDMSWQLITINKIIIKHSSINLFII